MRHTGSDQQPDHELARKAGLVIISHHEDPSRRHYADVATYSDVYKAAGRLFGRGVLKNAKGDTVDNNDRIRDKQEDHFVWHPCAEAAAKLKAMERYLQFMQLRISQMENEVAQGQTTTADYVQLAKVYFDDEETSEPHMLDDFPTVTDEAMKELTARVHREWSERVYKLMSDSGHSEDPPAEHGISPRPSFTGLKDAVTAYKDALDKGKDQPLTLDERTHMQPVVVELLASLGVIVGAAYEVKNTSRVTGLPGPKDLPDVSGVCCGQDSWYYLVFMGGSRFNRCDRHAVLGHLLAQGLVSFTEQKYGKTFRTTLYGVAVFHDGVEIIKLQEEAHEQTFMLYVTTTGVMPLLLNDHTSPGLIALVRFLKAEPKTLGYVPPPVPSDRQLSDTSRLTNFVLKHKGSDTHIPGMSGVYQADLVTVQKKRKTKKRKHRKIEEAKTSVIVKTGCSEHELAIMRTLNVIAEEDKQLAYHCCQLLEETDVQLDGWSQHAAIIGPVCKPWKTGENVLVIVQAAWDLADSVAVLAKYDILHRDRKLGNCGWAEDNDGNKHIMLYDYGIATEELLDPRLSSNYCSDTFLGTPAYAALPVLINNTHNISTELESNFYTIIKAAVGLLPDELSCVGEVDSHRQQWYTARRRAYMVDSLADDTSFGKEFRQLPEKLQEFISRLHRLFWRKTGKDFYHCSTVTVEEVKAVCQEFGATKRW